jgi:hypothetical protein
MPMEPEMTDNQPSQGLGQCRVSFVTALRYPDPSPGGHDVVGVTVEQFETVTVLSDLPDGTSLTFNSEELRRALDPREVVGEAQAA